MRILVTGGTGFTGSCLVKRLLNRGDEVLVIDNQRGVFFDELKKKGATVHLGNITDVNLVDKVMRESEVVYHIAAAFRGVNLPRKVYWKVNIDGTRIVAESALRHRVRKFIHCSTEGVHGTILHPPVDESAPIAPKDYYEYTKSKGEEIIRNYMKKGLKAVIIRPTAIYGPGDPGRFLLLFKWVDKGFFPMFGSGEITYHPVYIENLNDLFELVLEKDEANGQTYLAADEKYYSLNELVLKVAESLGVKVKIIHLPFFPLWILSCLCEGICRPLGITPPLFRRRADWYKENRGFSIEKAKRELGYVPKVDLKTGLKITADWYKAHNYI